MEKIEKLIELHQYKLDELSVAYQTLIHSAKEAYDGSYAPYSNFPVGAAILLDNGQIIKGSNQENAAYPSGLCAERTALFYCSAANPGIKISALAVCVKNELDDFVFPCGSCLQVMAEFQQKQHRIFDVLIKHPANDFVLISKGVNNLLPFAFGKQHLGK